MNKKPVIVACIGGLDPANAAGIGVDAQSIQAQGGHAYSIASCLTVQNPQQALQSKAVAAGLLAAQLRALVQNPDTAPMAIKVGAIADGRHWQAIKRYQPAATPLVIDPVLAASSGLRLGPANRAWRRGFSQLAEQASLVTPNTEEYQQLKALIPSATPLLITGSKEQGQIVNQLWQHGELQGRFATPLLDAEYRGTGCRLSSLIAYQLALGTPLNAAIERAMQALQQQLEHAYTLGKSLIPSAQPRDLS